MTTNEPTASVGGAPDSSVRGVIPASVRGWALWRWLHVLGPVGLPVAASVAAHAGIAIMLIVSAWSYRSGLAGGRVRTEVVISLPTPAPPNTAPREQTPTEPAPAAPVEAPPVLQGLASRAEVAPPPALRSVSSDAVAAADLLRRKDDAAIGATFAGLGARRAVSIVYVVDASGAMVSSLKFVLAELERSVRSLSSGQTFQVVLFREREGGALFDVFGAESGHDRLLPATPANKAALAAWLGGITPMGRSNPLDGLRRGLELDPDAVFLLSRSIRRSGDRDTGGVWGKGAKETLAELDALNPRSVVTGRRRVVIKAIQFLEPDPTGTMELIGERHGDGPGSYSVLSLRALEGR